MSYQPGPAGLSQGGPVSPSQGGQSLIESIVAIFVLTTGLSAGLALAIFAYGSSSDIVARITATALAREGVEVVRSIRDSNWLNGNLVQCNELGAGQICYDNWKDGLNAGNNQRVTFDSTAVGNKWILENTNDFRLYRQADGTFSHTATAQPTDYFRKLRLLNQGNGGLLIRVYVWWYGKRCNNSLTNMQNLSDTECKVVTEAVLTNWKNY